MLNYIAASAIQVSAASAIQVSEASVIQVSAANAIQAPGSTGDNQFYTAYTSYLRTRLAMHNEGKVSSTSISRPLKLIYFEGCLNYSKGHQAVKSQAENFNLLTVIKRG